MNCTRCIFQFVRKLCSSRTSQLLIKVTYMKVRHPNRKHRRHLTQTHRSDIVEPVCVLANDTGLSFQTAAAVSLDRPAVIFYLITTYISAEATTSLVLLTVRVEKCLRGSETTSLRNKDTKTSFFQFIFSEPVSCGGRQRS